jgi:hypothetical protein
MGICYVGCLCVQSRSSADAPCVAFCDRLLSGSYRFKRPSNTPFLGLEHHSHDRYAFLSSIQVYKPESLATITLDVLRTVVSTGASKANQEPVEYSPHMHGRKSGVSDKKVNLHAKMWKKSGSDRDTAHLRMWVRVSNFI